LLLPVGSNIFNNEKKRFFAVFSGFFREQGRQGRGTIMNLELRNSGVDAKQRPCKPT